VNGDPKLVEAVLRPEGRVRPRRGLVTASGWAALLTSAAAIWLAAELKIAGAGWLPWLACALPPAAAGGVCLARRPATSTGSAAVFASCIVAGAFVLQIPEGRHGLVLAASVFLLLCVGVSVIISATVTAVMISISGTVSPRRAVVWTAAALVFAAVSIPSPVYITGAPVQTIFAGNTGGENALAVCNLALIALPLVIAGLASARIATVIVVAWLPGAAAPLLGWFVFRFNIMHFAVWYYVGWLAWLAVAAMALAEARGWLSAAHSQSRGQEALRP
jgi:hypothetical protein